MPSTSYIDADGVKRYRSVQGTGTAADPYVADVRDATGSTGIGGQSDGAATTTTQTASLIALFKGFWTAFGLTSEATSTTGSLMQRIRAIADGIGTSADAASTTTTQSAGITSLFKGFWTAFGLISEAASTTGSLMQRIRAIVDRIGSYGDTASTTGSIMAQLRFIGDNQPVSYGDGTTQAAPKGVMLLAKGSGVDAGKVFGLTLDSNSRLPVSVPDAIQIADFTTPANKLAINASGQIGVNVQNSVTLSSASVQFSDTASRTSVVSAATDTLLLAANSARKTGTTIYNESTAILYVALGTTAASVTNYTVQVAAGGYYEVPGWYRGQIRGIWSAANGNARVTELS